MRCELDLLQGPWRPSRVLITGPFTPKHGPFDSFVAFLDLQVA